MAESGLAKKLLIKPGYSIHLIWPPAGFADILGGLPAGARIAAGDGPFDFVLAFAKTKGQVEAISRPSLEALKPGGVLWVGFPKGSSKVQTDLSRDWGWDAFTAAGWQLVSLISIDEMWSAARMRPIGNKPL